MERTQEQALMQRLDTLNAQVAWLVAERQKQAELWEEMTPVARVAMTAATEKLDAIERRGWLRLGGALTDVAARVLDHYTVEDVHALGDAVITILDTVRALTQPEVLSVVSQAGEVLQHADQVEPLGLLGMVRASRHDDVQRGMAVLLEVLRHVGRATQALPSKERGSQDRRARLAASLGPRRNRPLGIEREPVRSAPVGDSASPAAAAAITAPVCQPSTAKPAEPATEIDGVAFTREGYLVDPAHWTRELAQHIAAMEGIELTPAHWQLIDSARADFLAHQAAPNIRRLTQVAGVTTKDIYGLFPKAPGRTIARIAGTPKPAGCI